MNLPLDPFGQQPGLNKLYTQLCLFFTASDRGEIGQLLEDALQRLTHSVPWLGGPVCCDDNAIYYIRPAAAGPRLVMKDLDDQLPSLSHFRITDYAANLLDEGLIAPCTTFRTTPDAPAPVFLVQANLVQGGLLLVICGLHSCMDMAGQSVIITLLAKLCRGESLSAEELGTANLRGPDAMPWLDADVDADATPPPNVEVKSAAQSSSKPHQVPACWKYVVFSGRALAELKATASRHITTDFVSTDDCLSALIWQSITRARCHRLSEEDAYDTTLTRTVDARSAAGMSPSYTGNGAVKAGYSMPAQELLKSHLGVVASQLRGGLKDAGRKLRDDARLLASGRTPVKVSVEPSTGVNLSSWAKEQSYELDFGNLLGKPEAVRRPIFPAWESLVYLMPRRADGEIAVAVCLREEDMQHLEADATLAKYAHFAG